jgi:hypothetical protein
VERLRRQAYEGEGGGAVGLPHSDESPLDATRLARYRGWNICSVHRGAQAIRHMVSRFAAELSLT